MRGVGVRVGPSGGGDSVEDFAGAQGAALLGPFRGAPAADVDAAVEVLLRIQRLVEDFPQILEVEVNPFILAGVGRRSAAVDGRMRVEIR